MMYIVCLNSSRAYPPYKASGPRLRGEGCPVQSVCGTDSPESKKATPA